jgi:phospholipase/carboxylesterase
MLHTGFTMLHTQFIPAPEPSSPRLMIVLHGLGDSVEGYRWWPGAMQLPWLNYLLVNAPDPYYGGFAWYDLQDPAGGIERSRKLLFQLLDQLADRKFPAENIVFSGFSQGCLMSIEIGARLRHRLAGIVGISGYVHEPEQLVTQLAPEASRQRFLVTHGTEDPLIPIAKVRPQMDILRRAGLQIDWREFVKAHTIAGEKEMAVVREFVQNSYA